MICKNCGHELFEHIEKPRNGESGKAYFYFHTNVNGKLHEDVCNCFNPEPEKEEVKKE